MVNTVDRFPSRLGIAETDCPTNRRGRQLSLGFYLFCLLVAGLIGLCFAPQTANGATYYLDAAAGNDSNPGTEAQPWKTMARAYDSNTLSPNVEPGDTVYFKNGNYGAYSEALTASRSSYITYKAATGHTPVFTKITVTASSPAKNAYLKFDGINIQHPSYTPPDDGHWHYLDENAPGYLVNTINVNYLQFLNGSYKGCNHYISRGVNFERSNNVTIQRCEIATEVGYLLRIYFSDNVIIRNCYAHDFVNASGIQIQGTVTSILAENNHLFCSPMDPNEPYYPWWEKINNPTSIHSGSGFSIRSSNITIRKNIVRGAFAQGLMFYTGNYDANGTEITYHNMIVENNLFYDTSSNKMELINGACVIRNNTFIGWLGDSRITKNGVYYWPYICERYQVPLYIKLATGFNGSGVDIYNNIVVDCGWNLPSFTDPNLLFNEDHNIFYGKKVDNTNTTKGNNSRVIVWSGSNHGWPNYFEDIGYRGSTLEYNYATDGIQPFFVDPNYYTSLTTPALAFGRYKLHDYHLAPNSPGINFGDPDNQPSDSLGSLGPDGFIRDDGPARDASHHSAGAYEYISLTPPSPSILYGDVNSDGEISAYDAALAARLAVGLDELTADKLKVADVNGDSEVSAYDAALIAQRAVGLISKFPVE